MNEIKCPNCGTIFQIAESDYESIVSQIKDKEFQKELDRIEKQKEKEKESALEISKVNFEKKLSEELNSKNSEIQQLQSALEKSEVETKSILEKEYTEKLNKRAIEINELKNEMKNKEVEVTHSLEKKYSEELNKKELQIQSLQNDLKTKTEEVEHKLEKEYLEKLNAKEVEITDLQSKIKLQESENALQIQNTVSEKEQEITSLKQEIELSKNKFELKEQSLKDSYEAEMKSKDEQIAYYKDFKARQSTKMIGESLEQHCHNEFNSLRPLFKNAYFEKDNDAKTGSKGDFIFKDYDDDGTEFVSIMFEMKNEGDETASKHKNEDFLKELDKDRKEKNCEYAVLVSLLEMDNELYNNGIVDMSHKYEKMYVIRPQFFIPLITLIRNLAMNSLKYKKELQIVKNQNIDISHFEENMEAFKEGFGRNYRLASEKFKKAIDEIDKTIDHLQKTKDALLSSENNLRLANNKAEDLTIKKLTHNSETMATMFENMKKEEDKEPV